MANKINNITGLLWPDLAGVGDDLLYCGSLARYSSQAARIAAFIGKAAAAGGSVVQPGQPAAGSIPPGEMLTPAKRAG